MNWNNSLLADCWIWSILHSAVNNVCSRWVPVFHVLNVCYVSCFMLLAYELIWQLRHCMKHLSLFVLFVTSNSKQSVTSYVCCCRCDGTADVRVLMYLLFYLFIYLFSSVNESVHSSRQNGEIVNYCLIVKLLIFRYYCMFYVSVLLNLLRYWRSSNVVFCWNILNVVLSVCPSVCLSVTVDAAVIVLLLLLIHMFAYIYFLTFFICIFCRVYCNLLLR